MLKFRDAILARYGEKPGAFQHISRSCEEGKPSHHHEGRGWDWFPPDDQTALDAIAWVLAANPISGEEAEIARRAGVEYMIYDWQIWRSYPWAGAPSGTWGQYKGKHGHKDHVHFSLSRPGAAAVTSFYQNGIPEPPPTVPETVPETAPETGTASLKDALALIAAFTAGVYLSRRMMS